MKNKIENKLSWISAIMGVLVFVSLFSFVKVVSADSCSDAQISRAYYDGYITLSMNKISGSQVRITVGNYTNCSFTANSASFKVYDNKINGIPQTLIDSHADTVAAHSSYSVTYDLASCLTQVDIWSGTSGIGLGKIYGTDGQIFGDIPSARGNFCTQESTPTPPSTPALAATCTTNPSSVTTGSYMNWVATATGGSGAYTYSWSGTDSLSGNTSSVSKSYSTNGTKSGTVTVTSGTETVTANCSGSVTSAPASLTASCSASPSRIDIGEDIDWSASASGGTGSYTYSWTGTDSLSGFTSSMSKVYYSDGTKYGTVTVTSGSEAVTANCQARVDEDDDEDEEDDLSVSCYASPSNPQAGSRMNWYVRVSGGDGDYDYDWSGSDGLDSSSRSPYMTYNTPGTKTARVTVRDDSGNRDSDTCYANVNSVLAYSQSYQGPLSPAVYLNQIPSTGLFDNMKLIVFTIMLAIFSAWLAYVITSYNKEAEANK